MPGKINPDETAAVVDQTGRLKFFTKGPFAKSDCDAHLRACLAPKSKKDKVDHYHGATVVTGKEAEKAITNGRV